MAKDDPDSDLFQGVEAGEKICMFRGWIKDTQIATNGDVTIKFGVYGPDKWEALKVTDIREQVINVDVQHLRPVKRGAKDRSHIQKLRETMAGPRFEDVIDSGDVIDLTTAQILPRELIMSNGKGDGPYGY